MCTRFLLFVKAASNGRDIGDCPFSQRVLMFAKLKVPETLIDVVPVDISQKPDEFLSLNPDGNVPVLLDRQKENTVITDSAEINKYLDIEFPKCECHFGYTGPALDACSGVFPKLASLLKNKDQTITESLKNDLMTELEKVNRYLESDKRHGKFLIADDISEIDCMFLPRLRHVIVAAGHYVNFKIPDEMKAIQKYFTEANKTDIFTSTCCSDEEIIKGWSRHTS